MRLLTAFVVVILTGVGVAGSARRVPTQRPPARAVSYTLTIAPLMKKYCSPCHFGGQRTGGLALDTIASMLRGGGHGPAIIPGKANESRLVLMMEGKIQPAMPPIPNMKPLDTRALRAWIDAGAKQDVASSPPSPPGPRAGVGESKDHRIAAVAFSPDGQLVAAGGYGVVRLFNAVTGRAVGILGGHAATVTAVAFSPDGSVLTAAGGLPARSGEIRLWKVASRKVLVTIPAHRDVVDSLVFSADGTRLAAGSYDHDVSLWSVISRNTGTKSEVVGFKGPGELRDHTDSVFAVAFNRDAKLLASAAADRTVKVWDVMSGKRLFTLSEATAEVYAVAFSPDGTKLAAGGVDKALRTYSVSRTGGKLLKTAFAHNAPILRIVFSKDGRSIVTSGEDRAVKRWDADTLAEKLVYGAQPDWPQGIALSPNDRLLAVGRHDGSLALYDASSGKLLREPIKSTAVTTKAPAEPPRTSSIPGRKLGDNKQRGPRNNGGPTLTVASLGSVGPNGVVRGKTTRLTLSGGQISDALAVFFDDQAIAGTIVSPPDSNKGILRVDANIGPAARIGVHRVFVQSPHGTTGSAPFAVGDWPEVAQSEPNDKPDQAQKISTPCTVVGAIDQPGDVDSYRVEARAGEELVFEVVAQPLRSKLQPVLQLLDSSGKLLVESQTKPGRPDTLMGYHFTTAGSYVLQLRDYEGAAGGDVFYRLNIGEFPVVTSVYPTGIQKGTTTDVSVRGFNLKSQTTAKITAPADSSWGRTTDLQLQAPDGPLLHPARLAVGADPEVMQTSGNTLDKAQQLTTPVTVNGRLWSGSQSTLNSQPSTLNSLSHYYRFAARKGQNLVLDVMARRLGSPLDSEIEILNSRGKPVEQAVLRAVGKTEMVLNDRDSATNALRLQVWDDFHPGDFLMVGREVIKILRLPNGPDEDVFFRTSGGQRLGYLGTTPEYHSLGSAVYKVEVHPPGSKFSPNGYPMTRLYYRNDDGGPLYGKDSYVTFTAPADGDYVVRLTDTRGEQGDDFVYRLQIHEPRPDFRLAMNPEHPNVPRAGGTVIEVSCDRFEGFDGEIEVRLEGLPAGFTATRTTIQSGENAASILILASPDAETPKLPMPSPIRLVGQARIGGREVVHAVEPDNGARQITVLPEPDVKVTTDVREVVIHPGEEVDVEAIVERQGKFGNRVPIEVKNLPFGVKVQNIGLNAILVTEEDSSRKYTLYCEPWVKPMTRVFYTIANVEGGVANAALALVLRVEPAVHSGALGQGGRTPKP